MRLQEFSEAVLTRDVQQHGRLVAAGTRVFIVDNHDGWYIVDYPCDDPDEINLLDLKEDDLKQAYE